MVRRPVPTAVDGEAPKQVLAALEQLLERIEKQALAEPPRAGKKELEPPEGQTVGSYYQKIKSVDSSYCKCSDYHPFPGQADGYNSNSYVHGLIINSGGSRQLAFPNTWAGRSRYLNHRPLSVGAQPDACRSVPASSVGSWAIFAPFFRSARRSS